jgi:TATA-box binding protein (TBP) (component of TFIID and TFIIIB)
MIRIENVVMRVDFRQGIALDHLIMLEPAYEVIYKPFIFPGATVKDRHVSFLLFSSGRGVCGWQERGGIG